MMAMAEQVTADHIESTENRENVVMVSSLLQNFASVIQEAENYERLQAARKVQTLVGHWMVHHASGLDDVEDHLAWDHSVSA
jgi:hypothetical protein